MAQTRAAPEPISPSEAVVGVMTADGQITLSDCATCPYRGALCQVCIVPSIQADPDLEENQFPRPAA
jgi:hypothetical protein